MNSKLELLYQCVVLAFIKAFFLPLMRSNYLGVVFEIANARKHCMRSIV